LFLYDNSPGGIGLAEKCFSMQNALLSHALEIVSTCGCPQGCPSCAGPVGEIGAQGKKTAQALLKELILCP
jgi:DEAD/DEAH box helicase domain-containing protein